MIEIGLKISNIIKIVDISIWVTKMIDGEVDCKKNIKSPYFINLITINLL